MKARKISPSSTAAIRFGLAAIKNVGEGAVDSVLVIRADSGRFTSFFDFCRRVDLHKVNKRMLEGLIKAGAFDSLGAKRSQLMAMLDQAIEDGAAAQQERERGQTSIFGEDLNGDGRCARSHGTRPAERARMGSGSAAEI